MWELADCNGKHAEKTPLIVVVLGVSASGKTTIGKELANQIDCVFEDGDDRHPAENIRKLLSGNPHNDADRAPWLDKVSDWIWRSEERRGGKEWVREGRTGWWAE